MHYEWRKFYFTPVARPNEGYLSSTRFTDSKSSNKIFSPSRPIFYSRWDIITLQSISTLSLWTLIMYNVEQEFKTYQEKNSKLKA
jgi:hypothetical protein